MAATITVGAAPQAPLTVLACSSRQLLPTSPRHVRHSAAIFRPHKSRHAIVAYLLAKRIAHRNGKTLISATLWPPESAS